MEVDLRKLKKFEITSDYTSFACGRNNQHGLQMQIYTDNERVYSRLTIPKKFCGWNNIVHGGIVTTILEEIKFWAGFFFMRKIVLMKKVTIQLLRPVPPNTELLAIGYIDKIKRKNSVTANGELYCNKELCAKSNGVLALVSFDIAKRLGIFSNDDLTLSKATIEGFNKIN